jgi:hypothetical protein
MVLTARLLILSLLMALAVFAQTHTVTLTWAPNTSGDPVTTYNVLRGTTSGAEVSIGSIPASSCTTVCTFTDTTVTGGQTYFYEQTASNSGGTSAPSLESTFSVPFFPPNSPSKATITGR